MDFDSLTMEEQVQKLTHLAKNAVLPYCFNQPQFSLIKHEMNTIFKINTKDGESYVLRIHPQKWLGYEAINSEMNFISDIAKNTGLSVAEPVSDQSGLLIHEIKAEGIPGSRFCIIFKWLDGWQNEEKLDKEELFMAGEYLGRLHLYSESYSPPEGFVRPQLDIDGIFGEKGIYNPGIGNALFSNEQKHIFEESLGILQEQLCILGKGKTQFGMVHGDFYFKNWMFYNGGMSTFDYDICGWGYYLYDIIIPFWPGQQGNTDEAYKYFLEGYSRVRKVPDGFYEFRETFDAIRRLMDAYWIVTRQDNPFLKLITQDIVNNSTNYLKNYLKTR